MTPYTKALYLAALTEASALIRAGASAQTVAAFVLSTATNGAVYASLSRTIENEAYKGTLAEAVFDILCEA